MNITMMIALALALSAAPSVDAIRTHRRATGTELYRVQPTQKVMPVADASPMNALKSWMVMPSGTFAVWIQEGMNLSVCACCTLPSC
jgi:hypothetical protein